jgi:hypothetical protein
MEKKPSTLFSPLPPQKNTFLCLFKNEAEKLNPCPLHLHPHLTLKTNSPERGTKSFNPPPFPSTSIYNL